MLTVIARLTKNTDEKVDLINYDFSWNTLSLFYLGKRAICAKKKNR